MTSRPSVSVIILAYNAQMFVRETDESVLGQTYPAAQIIVVDDGSTDQTVAMLDIYKPRVHVVCQANAGAAAARNRGLDLATGDALAFVDADDVWRPDKLERQIQHLLAHSDCGVIHTAARVIDGTGSELTTGCMIRVGEPASGDCLRALIRHCTVWMSSSLVSKEALRGTRFGLGLKGVEDWDFWLQLARTVRFGYIDQPLIDYRVHGGNVSASLELMGVGGMEVMRRTLARETDRSIRREAKRQLRSKTRVLAHVLYESGRLREARSMFLRIAPFFRTEDLARIAATCLPGRTRGALRHLWQSGRHAA